nr:ankyrin repeat-containing protein At5g02620-like [Tanacetum cinerariifolium]
MAMELTMSCYQGTHFKKLIQCDPHLNFLNQQAKNEDLIVQHFNPRRADKKGQTTLRMAVKGHNVVVVSALINMVDKWDNTALHMTIIKGRVEIVWAFNKSERSNQERIN